FSLLLYRILNVSENLNVSISYRIDSLDVARARRSPKADVADTGVNLSFQDNHVIVSNDIVQITLSNPEGHLTGIQYKGVDNLLEAANNETDRGYWDLVWSPPRSLVTTGTFDRIVGTSFEVITETENQVELSFSRTWDPSLEGIYAPLKIDKRYVLLRGSSGFYSYAIYEHMEGRPGFNLDETRIAFKLRKDKKKYMPLPGDRFSNRGKQLAYPKAVLLVNPVEPEFKGQVDDKYQYSCETKDLKVHGWISTDPAIGFWQITPSNEFRTGGPKKQELTSHVGPVNLVMFVNAHYSGIDLVMKEDYLTLWDDAKNQMLDEVAKWPYSFPASKDFKQAHERGMISGRLFVYDMFISYEHMLRNGSYIGLAKPGDLGSWERENKGYQFWSKTNDEGHFSIENILAGTYNIYAWVDGFIGDYKNVTSITITPGPLELHINCIVQSV
ncbi:probable rhamnogalacturonate lyase B, partial [Tanacetum coccineum]